MTAQNAWQQGVLAIHCASVCTAAQKMPSTDIELGGGLAVLGFSAGILTHILARSNKSTYINRSMSIPSSMVYSGANNLPP